MHNRERADRLQAKKARLANHLSVAGHHSPEARAVQTFMRAFDGWCSGGLSEGAALVLAHQGAEDWLRLRLAKSHWDPASFPALISLGLEHELIDKREAFQLGRLHHALRQIRVSGRSPRAPRVAGFLFWLIEFIERRW